MTWWEKEETLAHVERARGIVGKYGAPDSASAFLPPRPEDLADLIARLTNL